MKKILLFVCLLMLAAAARAQGPAYPYSVSLSFTESTGTGITGHNMYRVPFTTTCGTAFTKINTNPFVGTSFADLNPPQGAYCYGATALAGTSESGLSNIVSNVVIPPPPPTGLGVTVAVIGNTNTVVAWNQSTGKNLTFNELFCSSKATGPFKPKFTSASPVTHVN